MADAFRVIVAAESGAGSKLGFGRNGRCVQYDHPRPGFLFEDGARA